MQWISRLEQYFSLYNINEIIFLSLYHINTVTKQRDPDTGQHSLLFQVIGLYRHCTCLANIIAFIQREQLITLKKSVKNWYGFSGSGLKTGVENDIFRSFLIIGSGFGESCGTSPPPRIPRSTPPPFPHSLWINAKEDPLGDCYCILTCFRNMLKSVSFLFMCRWIIQR